MYAVRKSKPKPQEEHHDTATQAFLREVDDALHEENMQRLWKQWRYPLFGALVLLFVGVGGWQVWQERDHQIRQAAANDLFALLEQPEDTAAAETIISNPLVGPSFLGTVSHARQLSLSGQPEDAFKLYMSLVHNEKLPQDFRDLAKFYAALVESETSPKNALAKLTELDVSGSALQPSVLSLQARLFELEGDKSSALSTWEKLSVLPQVPPRLAAQARRHVTELQALVR